MFSFKKFGTGPLKCVELATGKVKWEQPGFGAGNVILVNDQILALADDGQVVLVEARPTPTRNWPAPRPSAANAGPPRRFSDGRIYVRSTKEGACLDVR